MAASVFYIPSVNLQGAGSLQQAVAFMKDHQGINKVLIVTDQGLVKAGLAGKVQTLLTESGIEAHIYDDVHPTPTSANVAAGLAILKEKGCDSIVSLGGGSPHDCAKAIALVAQNGGKIQDYEGLDKSKHPQLPFVSINTTAGTASEMRRFCIITDEARHVKMAIVDKHTTPIISVNDPETMVGMPKALTAATGMDALTHAIEAYASTIATPITDACALKAVTLIAQYLPRAVDNGQRKALPMMRAARFRCYPPRQDGILQTARVSSPARGQSIPPMQATPHATLPAVRARCRRIRPRGRGRWRGRCRPRC